ncbi:MAG: glycosyltransferase family 4 protein [Caldilinea sp.]
MSALQVCIDARLISGYMGGVEQTIVGLAHGLSQLTDGAEIYHFLVYREAEEWLSPHLSSNCRLLYARSTQKTGAQSGWRGEMRSRLRQVWHGVAPFFGDRVVPIPQSDGVIEQAGIDVMHFATPLAFRTETPNLYQFFDVQHRMMPEHFDAYERRARDVQYQIFMEQAHVVAAMTSQGRQDLLKHYPKISADKVIVAPFGPAIAAYAPPTTEEQMQIAGRLALPEHFIFYPAQTWRHKNHIGLLYALAHLRDEEGIIIPLICSGRRNQFFPTIQQTIDQLQLNDQVRFLGFVSPQELHVLYTACHAVVFPSRYEGFGMPVLEAFQAGRPLACSNISPLAEIAGDAAVLFDPTDPVAIAHAIHTVMFDYNLRQLLCSRANARVAQFDWVQTARTFRAHYRRIAGRHLTDDDQVLLAAAPIV